MTNANSLLWLRAESKPFEQRTLLTPKLAHQLTADGYEVVVERSEQRVFDDDEYVDAGCQLVHTFAWRDAPLEAIILGLKELGPSEGPFTRRHVHFAHVFKDQLGWQETLSQFKHGGGVLYDLEYLTDASARRVAAFGYWAGFVGAAITILAFCARQQGRALASLSAWPDKDTLVNTVQAELKRLADKPSVLVIGALGRCGTGAIDLLNRCSLDTTAWDQKETAEGGPFDAIREHDVLINCVFVHSALPPFTNLEHLRHPARRLQAIGDVSCDPFGQYNPLPVYRECTSMLKPVISVFSDECKQDPLDLVAIDHLPSLLPRESSEDFASQLAATLLGIKNLETGAWQRARDTFEHHLSRLTLETSS